MSSTPARPRPCYIRRVLRRVRLPCDPLALARALEGRRGLAVLASGGAYRDSDARFSFVACDPVETSEDLVPESKTRDLGYAGHPAAPRWIGIIPYETFAKRDTRATPRITAPRWHRYDAVLRIDHLTGEVAVEADDASAADRLLRAASHSARAPREVALAPIDEEPARLHEARIAAALEYIARGDIYQVNLARRLRFAFEGAPLDHFANVFGKTPSPWAVHWEMDDDLVIAGTSPELAIEVRGAQRSELRNSSGVWGRSSQNETEKRGSRLRTAPIKGTRPRGAHYDEDEANRLELESSDKERAELVMAVDLHRNDLGRVARFGSVRVLGEPRTLRSRTVFSRVHEIVAFCKDETNLSTIASAMLPCGSVTGAPKVRAMEIIAELEPHRRGLYTGAIGYVSRAGDLVVAMAIRTSVVSRRERTLEYFTGGGIVCGSDPRREVDETNWKAAQLGGAKS